MLFLICWLIYSKEKKTKLMYQSAVYPLQVLISSNNKSTKMDYSALKDNLIPTGFEGQNI